MGPRKRAKRSPTDASTASLSTTTPTTSTTPATATPTMSSPQDSTGAAGSMLSKTPIACSSQRSGLGTDDGPSDPIATLRRASKQAHKTRSWYGSWPSKSSASTQVARETILGGTLKSSTTADFSRFETKKAADNMSLDGVAASVPPVLPKADENENRNGSGNGVSTDTDPGDVAERGAVTQDPPETTTKKADGGDDVQNPDSEAQERNPEIPAETEGPTEPEPEPRPLTNSGWLGGWFGRPTNPEPTAPTAAVSDSRENKPTDPTKATQPEQEMPEPPREPEQQVTKAPEAASEPAAEQAPVPPVHGSSWFGFWSSAPIPQPDPAPAVAEVEAPVEAPVQQARESEDVVMEDAPTVDDIPTPPPKAGSTWAFWSRDPGSSSGSKPPYRAEAGQLAVIGEGSESHPQRTNALEVDDARPKEPPSASARKGEQTKGTTTPKEVKKSKRGRPQSMDLDETSLSRPSTPKIDPAPKQDAAPKASASKTPTSIKAVQSNLLLPSFNNTYRMKENPSIIQQITKLILRTQQPPPKHVFLSGEPIKIKRAIAIGVHGLFPANYLRPMIGQPTGTSIKFANHTAEAIRRWADNHGCEDCEIEKVALEGDGKISERVENLWKLLLNWIDHIRNADLIILGCHSQGVPVAIMLLAKLIELGVVTTARVGVCAMAGVSLGPFPDYRSSMGMLMGSAAQLWEFSDPESEVSKRLEASTKAVLNFGARITFIGSMDDQVVPLESAIYTTAHHPYIYRAVFIDGRIHAPDFIGHLVGFAMKLRNLGVSDHGLIRELSTPLAGSLYSGEGHSRLYDDEQVYDLAITHALETTSVGNVPCEIRKHQAPTTPNPYHLPWIMRGLLEEEFVKSELNSETAELLRQFDDWKPVTKALKDVKYRLEAVRSKL
ncbi:hypothetical protein B0T22DRAFT_446617 [Podospora appendiculata]|uniref:YMC020W-like alpha/beta hydrolase domain-containing protein n=1 Tax=Podospora appendiculata TaxID=314037 RepID=A0AAE0XEV3_9PEZI|nr:hypothetical protein B0T22DRAFT_446617 [Podospora appendiculata]